LATLFLFCKQLDSHQLEAGRAIPFSSVLQEATKWISMIRQLARHEGNSISNNSGFIAGTPQYHLVFDLHLGDRAPMDPFANFG